MGIHVSSTVCVGTTVALILILSTGASGSHGTHPIVRDVSCPVIVRFSPHGGAERAVTEALSNARVRVRAALYGLTSPVIEHALAELARSGVHVALKTDRGQSAGSEQAAVLNRLQAAGVSVAVSRSRTPIHDKFAVVDSRWVITGSFNWTTSAERRNRENVLVLDCPDLAAFFDAEWETIAPSDP